MVQQDGAWCHAKTPAFHRIPTEDGCRRRVLFRANPASICFPQPTHGNVVDQHERLCDGADARGTMMMTRSNLKAAISSGRSKVSKVNPSRVYSTQRPRAPGSPCARLAPASARETRDGNSIMTTAQP